MNADVEWPPAVAGTRAKIVGAARSLVIERGFSAFSMESVASLSGFSRRTVYNQFDGREALYRAAMQQLVDTIEGRIDLDLRTTMPLAAAVRAFCAAVLEALSTPEYRDVVMAIARDGNDALWLKQSLQRRVLAPLKSAMAIYLLSLLASGGLNDMPVIDLEDFCARSMATLEATACTHTGSGQPFSVDEIVDVILGRLRGSPSAIGGGPSDLRRTVGR